MIPSWFLIRLQSLAFCSELHHLPPLLICCCLLLLKLFVSAYAVGERYSNCLYNFLLLNSGDLCCFCKLLFIYFILLWLAYLSLALSGPNKEQNQHAGSLGIKPLSGVMGSWDALKKRSREDKMMRSACSRCWPTRTLAGNVRYTLNLNSKMILFSSCHQHEHLYCPFWCQLEHVVSLHDKLDWAIDHFSHLLCCQHNTGDGNSAILV